MRIASVALLASFCVIDLCAYGCVVTPATSSGDSGDPGSSSGTSTSGGGSTSSGGGSTSASSSGGSTSGSSGSSSGDAGGDAHTLGDPGEGGPTTDPPVDGGLDGGGSADGGSATGVTCTYRLIHVHTATCDAQCALKNTLPPEETVVMKDVAVTTQTASGCSPITGARDPKPGPRAAEIHAAAIFDAFKMTSSFRLTGAPPLESFSAYIGSPSGAVCVANALRTVGDIQVKIVDGDKATVFIDVSHLPLESKDHCPGVIGCLRQEIECKGKTTATVLP